MKDIISSEILIAIKAIVKANPDVVFGGSIALVMVGLINRPVADIDLFLPHTIGFLKSKLLSIEDSNIVSETVTNTNGKEIQRAGFLVNGVKCCVFKVDDEELQHSIHTIPSGDPFEGDIKIKCQNVNYAIMAKRSYADRSGKHKIDLNEIDQKLNEI